MSDYFQFHEMNLTDALHCSSVLPTKTFCHFSASSHRICKL